MLDVVLVQLAQRGFASRRRERIVALVIIVLPLRDSARQGASLIACVIERDVLDGTDRLPARTPAHLAIPEKRFVPARMHEQPKFLHLGITVADALLGSRQSCDLLLREVKTLGRNAALVA